MAVPAVAGTAFSVELSTAFPAVHISATYGLGEAVVGGTVTPDTFMVDKSSKSVAETILGPKEQKIVSDGAQGVVEVEVSESEREVSSLSPAMLQDLIEAALSIEELYDGLHQDIEWGFTDGQLHLLQSRPITLLPASLSEHGLELDWTPDPPARCKFSSGPPPRCRLTQAVAANRPHAAPDRGEHAGPALPAVRGALPVSRRDPC